MWGQATPKDALLVYLLEKWHGKARESLTDWATPLRQSRKEPRHQNAQALTPRVLRCQIVPGSKSARRSNCLRGFQTTGTKTEVHSATVKVDTHIDTNVAVLP
jgi:hypothetical protein